MDLGTADVTIGTSAGSLVGAFLTSERLWRGATEIDFLASHPTLLARMVRTSTGQASQERAARVLAEAKSTDRETIIEIGRAAMASRNAPVDGNERSLRHMLGHERREAEALEDAGAKTLLVAANPGPGIDFMDPRQLAAAIEDGAARATSTIDDLAGVWGR